VTEWLTPNQVARERGVRVQKVRGWIETGELLAVDHAARRGGRRRWRVSRQALDDFDRSRSNQINIVPTVKKSSHTRTHEVVAFF
jgi:hypothetical protein